MIESEDRVVESNPEEEGNGTNVSHEQTMEQLLRERANFLNYKRRVDRERLDLVERVRADTVRSILPVLDDLERALAHPPKDIEKHPWVQGIELVHRMMMDELNRMGIQRFGKPGELFDPERHEALSYVEQPDATDQRVTHVHRHGYQLGGTLLRPAQVDVAGPPYATLRAEQASPAEPPSAQQDDAGPDAHVETEDRPQNRT